MCHTGNGFTFEFVKTRLQPGIFAMINTMARNSAIPLKTKNPAFRAGSFITYSDIFYF